MMRRTLLVLAVTAVAILAVPAMPAVAGGGCHAGVTTGSGTTVEMVDACFTPTTLRIQPGETVTFVNTDPMVHNVTANQWGHFDDLNQGDSFRATFADGGVYPFACSYHPGMSGAIVVGDGTGAGNGDEVSIAGTSVEPSASPAAQIRTLRTEPADEGNELTAWLGGAVIGIALGIAGNRALRRRAHAA